MARGTEEKTQLTVNTQGDECRHTQSEPQHTGTHMDSQSYNIVTSLLKYWEEEQQVLSAKSVQAETRSHGSGSEYGLPGTHTLQEACLLGIFPAPIVFQQIP